MKYTDLNILKFLLFDVHNVKDILSVPKHSDFDGTPDYRDKCPDTPRGVRSNKDGCPIK